MWRIRKWNGAHQGSWGGLICKRIKCVGLGWGKLVEALQGITGPHPSGQLLMPLSSHPPWFKRWRILRSLEAIEMLSIVVTQLFKIFIYFVKSVMSFMCDVLFFFSNIWSIREICDYWFGWSACKNLVNGNCILLSQLSWTRSE